MMDGKKLEDHYPKPFFDKNGDLWTYDPDFGWTNAKMMKRLYDHAVPKESPLRKMGRVMVLGTAGDIDNGDKLKKMFYSEE